MLGFLLKPFRGSAKSAKLSKKDLRAWWESTFTPKERDYILGKYQPQVVGDGDEFSSEERMFSLLLERSNGAPLLTLSALASWFLSPPKDLQIARRLILKGVELGEGTTGSVLDRHFIYHNMITIYYRDRTRDPDALELAIGACKEQIALAPSAAKGFLSEYPKQDLPEHTGYKQLAIVREKQGNLKEAIELSESASNQGWAGDWEKRIQRCHRRMKK